MGKKALFLYVNLSLHYFFTTSKLKTSSKEAIALVCECGLIVCLVSQRPRQQLGYIADGS